MHAKQLQYLVLAGVVLLTWGVGPDAKSWAQDVSDQKPRSAAADVRLPAAGAVITIPGPLGPFKRMAAISQEAPAEDLLPFLARAVSLMGYQSWQDGQPKATEWLHLLRSYLKQARELQALAGPTGMIQVAGCSDAPPLMAILGFGFRQPCGPGTQLSTVDAKRAFITMDSGFPLMDLEQSLRQGKPFSCEFGGSDVPILLSPGEWSVNGQDPVSSLMNDPALARLYSGMSHLDKNTLAALHQSLGMKNLMRLGPALEFYGSQICVRAGRVIVPGGAGAEAAWKSLAGASPESPADFVRRLLEKDGGWLAAYFDALARIPQSQQFYFTEAHRLSRFYDAMKPREKLPGPVGSVFRPAPGLSLLLSRLQLDPGGEPLIPGGLAVWKEILKQKSEDRLVRESARRASGWNKPEQFIEAMFSLSRLSGTDSPFQLYLVLSEIDRRRVPEMRLDAKTTRLLAENFQRFGGQYSCFTEWAALDNESISLFLSAAGAVDSLPNLMTRADAIGIFQANVGLWQILARQEEIPSLKFNESWRQVIRPFTSVKSSDQLFDAARSSLSALCQAAAGKPWLSQADIVKLLAGPDQNGGPGEQVRQDLANRIRTVMEAQRLAPLDTLFEMSDALGVDVKNRDASAELLNRRAAELRNIGMPKPMFSSKERNEWAPGFVSNEHAATETRLDFARSISQSAKNPNELAKSRALLTPFIRDTLVGLVYAYYEPPGAQLLQSNPLLVRSHDFSGQMASNSSEVWQNVRLSGRGFTAGGGTHLSGSLTDLPYALAEVEQDFITPENTQALIWSDLVPDLLIGAVVPRWWHVTPNELHAVNLFQRFGEDLLAAASEDPVLRQKILAILAERLYPRDLAELDEALRSRSSAAALSRLMPAEVFYLAAEFREQYPQESESWGAAGLSLGRLARQYPDEVNRARISHDFGAPHPALARTYALELQELKPMPTFLGYSSRLLAESWESNNLYWARLADERGYPPVMLHLLVPALTLRMVERIFGTHLEDWPALLRALRETGEEFRRGEIGIALEKKAALEQGRRPGTSE